MQLVITWNRDDVMNFCIRHQLYTRGTCDAYEKMLRIVEESPVMHISVLMQVACDIYDHSTMNNLEHWNDFSELAESLAYEVGKASLFDQ